MKVLMRVQASVYRALVDVRACKAVKEVKKIKDRGEVCTSTLSTFQ